MASGGLVHPFSMFIIFVVVVALLHMKSGSCFNPKLLNATKGELDSWAPAVATWYGSPTGAGSGGACGFANDVANPPFSAMITAGNNALFKGGKGCGACYQVKCTQNPACSWQPITVTLTDECPGECNNDPVHFDLSGTAFGALAKYGQASNLRNAGRIQIQYMRVRCNYGGTKVTFHVDKGSNANYFATAVEYENGDGDLSLVELKYANSARFSPMQQSWGATWKIDVPVGSKAPFSIRLTTLTTKKILVATDVIPWNWSPGQYYRSLVNF